MKVFKLITDLFCLFNKHIVTIKSAFFIVICWASGITLIRIGTVHVNLNEPDKIHNLFLIFIASGFLLILLPFFKKIKFGSVELEREIEQTKQEVNDLRSEVRQQLSIIAMNINTIGNFRNSVNVYNVPNAQEIKDETREIKKELGEKVNQSNEEKIKDELLIPHEDMIMALAQTRIRIEFLLRSILEKRLTYVNTTGKPVKLMSFNQLVREFFKEYPHYLFMQRSFDYVNQITSAGIHAQNIDEKVINEAIGLGATLISTLNDFKSN